MVRGGSPARARIRLMNSCFEKGRRPKPESMLVGGRDSRAKVAVGDEEGQGRTCPKKGFCVDSARARGCGLGNRPAASRLQAGILRTSGARYGNVQSNQEPYRL